MYVSIHSLIVDAWNHLVSQFCMGHLQLIDIDIIDDLNIASD